MKEEFCDTVVMEEAERAIYVVSSSYNQLICFRSRVALTFAVMERNSMHLD